ncbi:uncharacterized protein LOC112571226 isoform X3 [Pomacea canaliculata]|uniref:uncharacterized protein LOC112571226 isoform X3 n=1 Tax=Pomacea canaliculata TaxID=400727 RepID=UPI000D726944|nr:uncharacterized protein LOC112571226 isoform X3 [Pomacea canaliculata]
MSSLKMELLRDSSLLSSIQDKAYSKGSSDQECIDDVCYALIAGQNNSSTEVILDIGSPSRELEFLSSLDPLHGWNNPLTGDKDRDVADVHEVETVEEWQDRYAAAVDEDQKASISPLNIVQGQYMLSDTGLMNNLVKLPDEQLLPWKYFFPRANKQRKFSSNEIIPAAATSFTVIQSSGLVPLVMNNSTKPVLIQSTEEGSSEASYLNETSTCDVATTVHMNTSFCCPGGRDFLGVSASSDKTVLTKSQDKGGHCNSSVHNATIFPYSVNSACHLQNKNIAEKTGLGSQGDNDDLVSNARLGTKSRKSLENSRGKPSSTHIFESKMANPTKHKLCLVGGAKEELKKRRLLHYLLPVLPNEADSSAQVPCSSSGSICLTTGTSDVNVRNETIAVPFRAVQYFDKVYITETELKNSEEDLMNRHYEIERESIESVSRAMSKVTKLASRYDGHGIPVKGRKGIFFCKKKDFSKKTVRQLLMSCSTERDLEKDDTINSQSTKYFSENDKCTPKDASKMSRGLAEGSAAVESHENTYCSEICTLPTTEESENLNTSMEADLNERTDPSIAGSGCLPVVEKWRDLHNTITVQSCEKEELYKKPFILIVHESCQHPGDSEGDASKNVLDAGDPTSLQLNQPCSFSDECLVKENAVENKSVIQVQTPCEVSNMASVCSRDSWLHSSFASENGAADSSYAGYLDLDALLDFQDLDLFCEEDIFDKENVKEKPDGNKMARELEILTTGKQNGATIEECSHKPSHLRYSGADDKDFSCMNETLAVQLTGDDQHFKGNKKSHVPDFLELADAIMQIEEDQLQKLQEFELQHLDTDSQCKHTQPLVPETQVQGVQSGSEPMNVEVDEALHHSINKQNHLEKSEYVHDACLGSALEFHLNQDKEQLTKDSVETQSKTDLFIIQDFLDPDKDQAASSSSYSDPLDVWMEESLPPLPPCALFLSKPEHHGNSTYDWLDMNFLHKTAEENPGESTFSSLDCDFWTADCEDCFVQHLENIPQTHVEKMDCDVSGLREHASESIFLQDSSNVIVVHSSVGAELSPGIATADSNRCTSPLSCNSVSLQLPFSDLPMDFTFLRPLSSQSPTTISSCVSKEGEECNSMYREEENYNVENIQGVENALITPMTNDSVPKFSVDEENKSANTCKLKLVFWKRTLYYEMHVGRMNADFPHESVVVDVPFDNIVGLWGRDKEFLIEVNAVPRMYVGHSSKKSLDVEFGTPVDITGGKIKCVPYHCVYLSHTRENTVKQYFCKDPHLRKLLVKSVTVNPYHTLYHNPEMPHGSWEEDRILNVKVMACRCKVNCIHSNCKCRRKNQKCNKACACVCCKNPQNTLDQLGLSMESIANKSCLMSCISAGKNLKNLLKKEVTLKCCDVQLTLQMLTTGSVCCPKCSVLYKFSWCKEELYCEDLNPLKHCEACDRCVDATFVHCQTCRCCVMVNSNGECLQCL